jgi:predicted RNase H-like HicB family nuclease
MTARYRCARRVATVRAVSAPLVVSFNVVYEDVEDGWVMARVVEKPAAISQGRTREEARENVRDALRTVLLFEADQAVDRDFPADSEPLELKICP